MAVTLCSLGSAGQLHAWQQLRQQTLLVSFWPDCCSLLASARHCLATANIPHWDMGYMHVMHVLAATGNAMLAIVRLLMAWSALTMCCYTRP
jgi:hypothetical protein